MQTRTRVLIAVLVIVAVSCSGFIGLLWATMALLPTPVVEGAVLRVQVPNDFGTYCANTENLARAAVEVRQARDTATLERWVREQAIWFLQTNDRVQVARISTDLAFVQVLTGLHAGQSCWAPSSALTR